MAVSVNFYYTYLLELYIYVFGCVVCFGRCISVVMKPRLSLLHVLCMCHVAHNNITFVS